MADYLSFVMLGGKDHSPTTTQCHLDNGREWITRRPNQAKVHECFFLVDGMASTKIIRIEEARSIDPVEIRAIRVVEGHDPARSDLADPQAIVEARMARALRELKSARELQEAPTFQPRRCFAQAQDRIGQLPRDEYVSLTINRERGGRSGGGELLGGVEFAVQYK